MRKNKSKSVTRERLQKDIALMFNCFCDSCIGNKKDMKVKTENDGGEMVLLSFFEWVLRVHQENMSKRMIL